MAIYLIHHVAETERLDAPDAPLTDAQRARTHTIGEALRDHGVSFDALISSPYSCAAQTAEGIAAATGFLGTMETHRALSPGVPAHVTAGALAGRGDEVGVVGHGASLTALCGLLLGLPRYASFAPGMVIAIAGRQPLWKLDPSTLLVVPLMLERK